MTKSYSFLYVPLIYCLAFSGQVSVEDFDYFVLTRVYPTAVCRADDDKIPGICIVPNLSSQWTIHGLWPSKNGDIHYDYCKGEQFNLSAIIALKERLNKEWPNLFPSESESSLWKHEWEKHGRCAKNVIELNNELRYFNFTLFLHNKYPISSALESQGISPSSKYTYSLKDIENALGTMTGSRKAIKIYCLRDKKTKSWLLADVRICMNKNFEINDCPKVQLSTSAYPLPVSQPCPSEGLFYVEAEHQTSTVSGSLTLESSCLKLKTILSPVSPELLKYDVVKK